MKGVIMDVVNAEQVGLRSDAVIKFDAEYTNVLGAHSRGGRSMCRNVYYCVCLMPFSVLTSLSRALERVPSQIRAEGGVARMVSDTQRT